MNQRTLSLFVISICWLLIQACNQSPMPSTNSLDLQGHRGCRGLMPENTIPAFLKAIDIGVNTLELDVVITKDSQVVVSHEPFMSHEICLTPEGEEITEEDELNWNIYRMTYEEVKACDCGTKPHPRFPDQEKLVVHKPLLSDVIDAAEAYAQEKGVAPLLYNIETKSQPKRDNVYHPEPEPFVDLLLAVVDGKGITERTIIQSFDPRTLEVVHEKRPEISLAYLIEHRRTPESSLEILGFTPDIYSPAFILVDEHLLNLAKEKNMQIIPWTVNEKEDIRKVLDMNVDGIISDFPDRVVEVLEERKLK